MNVNNLEGEVGVMDNHTFKILDTLSSNIGNSLSINKLTEKIKERHGKAHYPIINKKSHELEKQEIITLESYGKSSIIKLNFRNYLLADILAEVEIKKKLKFLTERKELFSFFEEMEENFEDICGIKSICSIEPIRNIKLNRIEFLLLLGKNNEAEGKNILTKIILKKLFDLQRRFNIKIDSFILDEDEFNSLLISDELNPLQDSLIEKIAFFCPQAFWSELAKAAEKSTIRTPKKRIRPDEINENDLSYNLIRFGYREFGSKIERGKKYRIEYIITSILLQDDIRRIEAIPIILFKNDFNPNLLLYLSQKTGTSGKLLSLMKLLYDIKENRKISQIIENLESIDSTSEEIETNRNSIVEKMNLYNVT